MTDVEPDWADEEIKRLSASYWGGIAGDKTLVSWCEAATSLRAAYERGKADAQTEIEKLCKLNQETANNYAKMWEVVSAVANGQTTGVRQNARTILKEIDNAS